MKRCFRISSDERSLAVVITENEKMEAADALRIYAKHIGSVVSELVTWHPLYEVLGRCSIKKGEPPIVIGASMTGPVIEE